MLNKFLINCKNKKKKIFFLLLTFCLILFFAFFCFRRNAILNITDSPEISEIQKSNLDKICLEYRIKNIEQNGFLYTQNLPYKTIGANLEINARSAILINADTGDILYQKDCDKLIPPASMTKIFLMYTVFKKIQTGEVHLDDIVPIGSESYACNMPPHSSLMFLGKNQIVTLKELLTGLAVCSGNDASHAIAYFLFGSVEKFLEEVNFQIKNHGLKNTVIVEPSGYSENNITTAREMADFARLYLTEFPESLELFHSVRKFEYPKSKNIALSDKNKMPQDFSKGIPESIWTPIIQENTNQLLKTLEGCDGLKTGFINESGYNLALTCKRDGVRYLSVTMNGPGNNILEGDFFRQRDGTTLQEFAFNGFTEISNFEKSNLFVKVLGAKQNSFNLIIPCNLKTAIPKKLFKNGIYDNNQIAYKIEKPNFLFGKIEQGKAYGSIQVFVNDILIRQEDLLSDRDISESNIFQKILDKIVYLTIKK